MHAAQAEHWATRHAGTEAVLQYMRTDPDEDINRLVPPDMQPGGCTCSDCRLCCSRVAFTFGCVTEGSQHALFLQVLRQHMDKAVADCSGLPSASFTGALGVCWRLYTLLSCCQGGKRAGSSAAEAASALDALCSRLEAAQDAAMDQSPGADAATAAAQQEAAQLLQVSMRAPRTLRAGLSRCCSVQAVRRLQAVLDGQQHCVALAEQGLACGAAAQSLAAAKLGLQQITEAGIWLLV